MQKCGMCGEPLDMKHCAQHREVIIQGLVLVAQNHAAEDEAARKLLKDLKDLAYEIRRIRGGI